MLVAKKLFEFCFSSVTVVYEFVFKKNGSIILCFFIIANASYL